MVHGSEVAAGCNQAGVITDNQVFVGFGSQYCPSRVSHCSYYEHVEFQVDFERGWIDPLKGKVLVCDCEHRDDKCHASVLLYFANPVEQQTIDFGVL